MKHIMRFAFILLICLQPVARSYAQLSTEYIWQQKGNFMGGKTEGAATFSIGGKGYVCMATSGKDIWRYDPSGDTWKKMADFPGDARRDPVTFTIGDKVYLGLGIARSETSNTDLKDMWVYDPVADHWEQIADFPGGERHGAIGFTVSGKAYVGLGGESGRANNYNDMWEYDPKTNKWLKVADFPETGRADAGVFVVNNIAYVLFGDVGIKLSATKKNVYKYSAEKDEWTKDVDFPGDPRIGATVFSFNHKGFVFAGSNGGSQRFHDFWEYTPSTKTWKEVNPDTLPGARNDAFCFKIDSTIYIGTGRIKSSLLASQTNDFWSLSKRIDVDFKAKLLYQKNDKKVPLAQQGVSLVSQEKVLQTTTTDSTGAFGFKKVDVAGKYSLVLDKNDKLPDNAVVSLARPSGKIVMDLKKNSDDQFAYEVSKMDLLNEDDDSYFNLQYFMKSTDKEITITTHINYPTASWDLSDDAKNLLYQVIVSLKQYPTLIVMVSSHTDAVGNSDDNMKLSEKRAQTVVDYLVTNGIDPKRVQGKGYGDTMLLNHCKHGVNCSDEENAVNRRTEFKFIKP